MDLSPKNAYYGGLVGLAVGFGVSFVQPVLGFAVMAVAYGVSVVARPMREHGNFRTGLKQGGIRIGLIALGVLLFYVGPVILLESAIGGLIAFLVFLFVIQPLMERRVLDYFGLPTTHLGQRDDEDHPDKQTA